MFRTKNNFKLITVSDEMFTIAKSFIKYFVMSDLGLGQFDHINE
jgi:hypothetical protein